MPKPQPSASLTVTGTAQHGGTIGFTVAPTTTHWNQIQVTGKQNGVLVYGALIVNPADLPGWPQSIILSSRSWTSGSADMLAELQMFNGNKVDTIGTLAFTAVS